MWAEGRGGEGSSALHLYPCPSLTFPRTKCGPAPGREKVEGLLAGIRSSALHPLASSQAAWPTAFSPSASVSPSVQEGLHAL